jgi:hypothetical protein
MRVYGVDDRIINKYEVVDVMGTGRGNQPQ